MTSALIQEGEELLKPFHQFPLDSRDDLPNDQEHRKAICWLWNNAPALLQAAKEREMLVQAVQNVADGGLQMFKDIVALARETDNKEFAALLGQIYLGKFEKSFMYRSEPV